MVVLVELDGSFLIVAKGHVPLFALFVLGLFLSAEGLLLRPRLLVALPYLHDLDGLLLRVLDLLPCLHR